MTKQEQVDAIKAGLAALDSAIAQTDAALRTASNPDDVRSLTSTLVDLRSERSRLQTQLDNLEAALVEVAPPARANAIAPLQERLTASLTDRTVVAATLTLAKSVHEQARELRSIGDEPRPKPRARKKASR
jgi:hypothetical protein